MKITVMEIKIIDDKKFVCFNSSIGNGFGEWKSRSEPEKLKSYFVEFNVEDQLVWLKNIYFSESEETSIQYANGEMILQGVVESIEDRGECCFMRLDSDLFIFSCSDIPNCEGKFVKISATTVEIFDVNL